MGSRKRSIIAQEAGGASSWLLRALAAWGLGVLLMVGPVQAEGRLTALSFTAQSGGQGYVIRAQMTEQVSAYRAPERTEAHTLKWVLYNTRLHEAFQKGEPAGPVRRYSVTQEGRHLVFRFHLSSKYEVEPRAYRDGASTDLLLSLTYSNSAPVANGPTDPPADRSSSSTVGGGAQGGAQPADFLGLARERWKLDKIVIDPGHGGKDPGAVANGLQEKDIVLDVALQLGEYIENRLGIEVAYTRTDDRFIPLEKRGEMANKEEAKLFISLHVNASRDARAYGTETYFLGPSKTDAARRVMERENSVVRYEEETDTYEEYDEQALVRQTLTQSAFMLQSDSLAVSIQNQFKNRVHRRSRGVHQAGFYVLWSASMPAVLVEMGFLTNPREARFVNSERGQTYLASAIFRAVRAYKNEYEKGIVVSGE